MVPTFKEAFCRHFQCNPERFESEVLMRCLYPQARAGWKIMDLTGARTVFAAKKLVELVGDVRSKDELLDAITEYQHDFKPFAGFLAKTFKLRVSIERMVALYELVCPAPPKKTAK